MPLIAKKSLSQNFLINPQTRHKVVKYLEQNIIVNNSKEIVEIGPGTGLLTRDILALKLPITAIEIDPRAIEVLSSDPSLKPLKIIPADATELIQNEIKWKESGLPSDNYILFGNLPFNTGSRLVVDFCLYYPETALTVILQKEVIDKLTKANNLTLFAAWILLFHEVNSSFVISAGNFDPKPKVDTALISLSPKQSSDLKKYLDTLEKRKKALGILKSLFQFPRKTIGNNLKNYDKGLELYQKIQKNNPNILEMRLNRDNLIEVIGLILES